MRIEPESWIPNKNPNQPDPYYEGMYPREDGAYTGGRWRPGWRDTVQSWFKQMDWTCYHTKSSTKSQEGFPDLVCVHTETQRTIFAELKTETGQVSDKQQHWLSLLCRYNEVYLWRPSDTSEIQDLLREEHDTAFKQRT